MATIEFTGLDEEHGFNLQKDVQKPIGHLMTLKIGDGTSADTKTPADISAETPDSAGVKQKVVGIMTSWTWAGGHGDPILMTAMISTANKQVIELLRHKALKNTNLEIQFKIWDYDPVAKVWFVALCASPLASNPALKGLILKEDKNLKISVSEKGSVVQSPENWKLEIGIMPAPLAQDIVYATGDQKNVVKEWGVTVGAAT